MSNNLHAALAAAARGWPVLPCHYPVDGRCSCSNAECASPGKHPRVRRGLHDATCDARAIRRWWQRWPNANLAVRTGASPDGAGIVVIDIDPRHHGNATLATIQARHATLPPTLAATSGSGGRHLVFQHPGQPVPNSAGRIGPGIDVRGDGGYVLIAPSRHASGRHYHWQPAPVAPLPAWLLELARPQPIALEPTGVVHREDAWAGAALRHEISAVRSSCEGSRNDTLNRAAFSLGQLVGGGQLEEAEVVDALTIAASATGLGLREVRATIASGLRAGRAHPRHRQAG